VIQLAASIFHLVNLLSGDDVVAKPVQSVYRKSVVHLVWPTSNLSIAEHIFVDSIPDLTGKPEKWALLLVDGEPRLDDIRWRSEFGHAY
jgi:hypothetical protein